MECLNHVLLPKYPTHDVTSILIMLFYSTSQCQTLIPELHNFAAVFLMYHILDIENCGGNLWNLSIVFNYYMYVQCIVKLISINLRHQWLCVYHSQKLMLFWPILWFTVFLTKLFPAAHHFKLHCVTNNLPSISN